MSIPLVQDNEKDSINTSLIAIKRSIDRINALLGLADSGGSSPDLSGLATKQELQDAVNSLQPVDEVTVDNMQSVTSNAVAEEINDRLSYHSTPQVVGKWIDGVKDVYRVTLSIGLQPSSSASGTIHDFDPILKDKTVVKYTGSVTVVVSSTISLSFPICGAWDSAISYGFKFFVNHYDGSLSYQRGTDSKYVTNIVFLEVDYVS